MTKPTSGERAPHLQHPFTIREIAAPLLADLVSVPAQREPPSARRPSQVTFVRDKFVPNLEASWESEAWAQRCAEIAYGAKFVFDEIAYRGAQQRR